MRPKRVEECGCCEVGVPPTPEQIRNRPGLPTIAYRVGTYANFRQAMIEEIAKCAELKDWRAGLSDDYGIALLEMWAYLADILTFYQDRIADEAFLRTALHRDTIIRLASMLDYKLNPGVAATTHLTFFVEDGVKVNIPVGLRVQSVPGQDEKPQKFETIEAILADARLNQVRVFPKPKLHNPLKKGSKRGVLDPENAEAILGELAAGDKLVIFSTGGGGGVEEKEVEALEVVDGQSFLSWSAPIYSDSWTPEDTHVFKWLRKFNLFGHNAPEQYLNATVSSGQLIWSEEETDFTVESGSSLNLDSLYSDLKLGTPILISYYNFTLLTQLTAISQVGDTRGPLSGTVTAIALADSVQVIDDLRKVTIYELAGSKIAFRNQEYSDKMCYELVYVPSNQLEGLGLDRTLVLDDKEGDPQAVTVTRTVPVAFLNADAVVAILEANRNALTNYERSEPTDTLSLRILLTRPNPEFLRELSQVTGLVFSDGRVEPHSLVSLDDTIKPDLAESWQISPDGLTYTFILRRGVLMAGGEDDHLAIVFTPRLKRSLDTRTAVLHGNVVRATHGETISDEVLGSGDASNEFQSFRLKKSPTTFVPAPDAPRGAKNTLEIRVNGALWEEAESLYGHSSTDRVYVTRIGDDGKMSVRFGDGKTGARLPTGQHNVAAKYRQGLGGEGNVRGNSLTTLLDRPVGLKSVTNPRQAEGGTDPESLQDARENAPNTVRTFERAISLRDYEDIARSYTGIAKARARSKLEDETEAIHLTVAGEDGVKIEIGSETYNNLVNHLDLHRDSNHILQVIPHGNVPLVLKALIQVDPRHLAQDVLPAARRAILHSFDFDNLQLGQGIHLSDIYTVLQEVDGVKAAVIEKLDYRESTYPALKPHLRIDPDKIAALEDSDLIIIADLTQRG